MKVLAIFIIGLGAFVANVNAAVCPTGWTNFSGKCILYSKRQYNYKDAATFCKRNGGKLYEPQSLMREAAIRTWAVAQGPAPGTRMGPWIGVNDMDIEGKYVYTSSGTPTSLLKWSTTPVTQPDNYNNEDCVHLLNPVDPAGLWNDWKCHYKLGALCERPAKKDCECCEKMKAVLDECCKDDQPDRPTEVEPEPVDQVVDING